MSSYILDASSSRSSGAEITSGPTDECPATGGTVITNLPVPFTTIFLMMLMLCVENVGLTGAVLSHSTVIPIKQSSTRYAGNCASPPCKAAKKVHTPLSSLLTHTTYCLEKS